MKIDVKYENNGNCAVILLVGSPDFASTATLADEATHLLYERGATRLVFDLERLRRIDCQTIGSFLRVYKMCLRAGANMRLTNVDRRVMHILELTKVANVLCAIGPDHDSDLKALARAAKFAGVKTLNEAGSATGEQPPA
jgi:anti-anti-sigma factor